MALNWTMYFNNFYISSKSSLNNKKTYLFKTHIIQVLTSFNFLKSLYKATYDFRNKKNGRYLRIWRKYFIKSMEGIEL